MRPRRARSSHREEKYFHFSFHARTDSFGLLLSHVDILPIKTRRKCLIRNSLVLTGRVSSQMVTQIILSFDILCGSKGFCATAKTDPESMISFPFACSFGVFFFFLFIPNRDTLDSLQQLFKIISRANNECYREIVVFILSPAPPFSSTSCVQLNDVGLVNGAL